MKRTTGSSLTRLTSRFLLAVFFAAAAGFVGAPLSAQEPNPTQGTPAQGVVQQEDGIYIYRVKVVQRDLDAVNYFHRSGATTIGFKGTTLLP